MQDPLEPAELAGDEAGDLREEEAAARCDRRDDEGGPELIAPDEVAGPSSGPRTPKSASTPTAIPTTISTCPTTPSTERMTIVSCVLAGIGAQGIRPGGERYADRAGVAELVRRARLKIGWPSGRAGSSPAPGIAPGLPDPGRGIGLIAMDALSVSQGRLRALFAAGLAVTSELSLEALLHRLVETAAELTGARYAALGVIDATARS